MATVQRFEDLEIWQSAKDLYLKTSVVCEKLKLMKEFRFAEQMRSAAGSIMDNIAEGFERNSRLEFINSLSISKGEAGELKSQFYRALIDNHINQEEFAQLYELADKQTRRTASFIKYLNQSTIKGLKFKERSNSKANEKP